MSLRNERYWTRFTGNRDFYVKKFIYDSLVFYLQYRAQKEIEEDEKTGILGQIVCTLYLAPLIRNVSENFDWSVVKKELKNEIKDLDLRAFLPAALIFDLKKELDTIRLIVLAVDEDLGVISEQIKIESYSLINSLHKEERKNFSKVVEETERGIGFSKVSTIRDVIRSAQVSDFLINHKGNVGKAARARVLYNATSVFQHKYIFE